MAAIAVLACVASMLVVAVVATATRAAAAGSSCGASINPIACENQQPGTPASTWDISGAGDATIQGYSTNISVNAGSPISFKIKTSTQYAIDIYRLGYYGGDGASLKQSNLSHVAPVTQPTCLSDASTGLFDCGNWSVSATWTVPSTAVSGVYIAKLTKTDGSGGASHITFVVRNDASTSDVVYQTSDETWQAYNRYGGSDFYTGSTVDMWDSKSRARKISYNRPFATRDDSSGRDFLFSNEYPTIRFMEQNGYDVSYIAGVDSDRAGSLLKNHKVFLSVGHDEYWSQAQRNNVMSARDAGVSLMFLSGNEMYWHTRFEPSIDGSNTAYRTLVCYKTTWDNANTDPTGENTSTWRDPRFSSTTAANVPENAVTGTMYMSNTSDLPVTVTSAQGKTRLWRNTGLASMAGSATALAPHTVGYESDEDLDNGFRPSGLVDLSTVTGAVTQELQDFGNTVVPGTTTHHLTMYRAASGALVFSAGTVQWGWGLDANHDGDTSGGADVR
ncbi:MAG: N,N-dimethylformamidase beta subunit family domain-containing protein, partial [Jatrophihabitantaceae bacterium]